MSELNLFIPSLASAEEEVTETTDVLHWTPDCGSLRLFLGKHYLLITHQVVWLYAAINYIPAFIITLFI